MKSLIKFFLKEAITLDRVPNWGDAMWLREKRQTRIAPTVDNTYNCPSELREKISQPAKAGTSEELAEEIPMIHRNSTSTLILALLALLLLFALPNATHAEVEQAAVKFYMDSNYDTNEELVYDASDDDDGVDDRDGYANNIIANPDLRAYSGGETGKINGRDWYNEISSLKVLGGAMVTLYNGVKYTATAAKVTYTSDQSELTHKAPGSSTTVNNMANSLKVFLPAPSVTPPTSLDFGNLYLGNYDGATDYNKGQTKTFTLKNVGELGTTLDWEITDADAIFSFSANSGSLDGKTSVDITVWADPTSSGAASGSFTIETSNGDKTITLNFTAYDTPSSSQIAPALGSNGRVNIGSGEKHLFEVVSGDPSFLGAHLKGYQWQMQRGTIDVDSTAWEPTSGNGSAQKEISLTDEGEWTVYAQMVDNNMVANEPIAIPVTVWPQPVVSATPPDGTNSGDWLTDTYVGVVNQPITLQATSDLEPTLSASGLTTESQVGSGAGDFNGSTLVSIDNRPAINDSFTDKTVALWFKTNDLTQNKAIIYEQGGVNHGVSIYLDDSNLYAGVWTSEIVFSKWLKTSTKGITLNTNRWYHVALELDSMDKKVKLWLDGEQIDSADSSGKTIDAATEDNGIGGVNITTRIHNNNNEGISTGSFSGQIDDVGIFNRALLDIEIADLADKTSFGLTGRSDDLEDSLVYINTFDYDGTSVNRVSRYLWFDSSDNLIATQLPGQSVDVTFSQQNLAGSLSCVAVTNHGIKSDPQVFDLKVYPTLTVDTGGPYVGKPSQAVTLSGSVNEASYPSASFSYQWAVDTIGDGVTNTPLTASDSPQNESTWSADGEYVVTMTATVTTQEGRVITASNEGSVTLETGKPTALPGGPYRGGILGGNFSPIQLLGNPPDFSEDTDVGEIAEWQWSFGPKETGLTFDGVDDHIEIASAPLSDVSDWTIMAWVNPNSGQAHRNLFGRFTQYHFQFPGASERRNHGCDG